MTDCLFCKIAAKTIPAEIVHEDDRALAFRDINPQAPFHVLVIPRVHIRTIDDILPEHEGDVGHLFTIASKIAAAEGLSDRGYRAVMNCKGEAGQSVYHIHLHVLGGRPLGWPPFPKH
jgi:histidine triad (HIT) family protein